MLVVYGNTLFSLQKCNATMHATKLRSHFVSLVLISTETLEPIEHLPASVAILAPAHAGRVVQGVPAVTVREVEHGPVRLLHEVLRDMFVAVGDRLRRSKESFSVYVTSFCSLFL